MKKFFDYDSIVNEKASTSHFKRLKELADQSQLKALLTSAKKIAVGLMEDDEEIDDAEVIEFIAEYLKQNF